MKIAIDCRYIGKSGIGRVCEGILGALDYRENEYYLIGKAELLKKYQGANVIAEESDPYSVRGLFLFPKQVNRICDALVIPNFLIPYGVKLPVFTIMHDLAFLDVKETTRGVFDRAVKRFLLKRCMKKSKAVSCVSEFTRERCEYYYGKRAEKCFVNYNGISPSVFDYAEKNKPQEKSGDIVFVGNVKPHKGLKTLLAAFRKAGCGGKLKIIGEKDSFLTGLDLDETAYENVIFTGKMGDEQLFSEIQRAKFLALPSKYEGFGLPPMEALCLGTQPIVSDIPVFLELYGGFPVVFFHADDEDDLAEKLTSEPQKIDCCDEISRKFTYQQCCLNLISKIYEQLRQKK